MARSLGSLVIDIEARTARLEADLGKTRGLLKRLQLDVAGMSKGFQSAFGLASAAVGAFASIAVVSRLKELTMGTLEQLRAQEALSRATGLGVNDLMAYAKASEFLGVTEIDLARAMKNMFAFQTEVRAHTRTAVREIEQMGLTVEDFAGLKPAELFDTIVASVSKLPDAAQRAAFGIKLFGKESLRLNTLLTEGAPAIAAARKEIDRLNLAVTQTDTAKVEVALTAVTEFTRRWEGFVRKLTVGLTPLVYGLAKMGSRLLESIDVKEFAEKIAHGVIKVGAFIWTIPTRLKVMLLQVQQIWYDFIKTFDTGEEELWIAKIFGTQKANQSHAEAIAAQIKALKADISGVTAGLITDFDDKVLEIVNRFKQMPAVVSSGVQGISTGMKAMVDEFAQSFQHLADITDKFIDGESFKFGDFLRDMVKMIVKTFLKVSLINPLLNGVFGSMMGGTSGGWWTNLPSLFGGGKAHGGPVEAGSTHLVGEQGPEVVSFGKAGYITPNNRLRAGSGDGGSVVIHQHFSSGLQRSELAAIVPSIVQQSRAAVADAMMRGGGFRKAFA